VDTPVDWGGAGLLDTLLTLFVATSKARAIILLDEPGVNLHPSRQARLLRKLEETSSQFGSQLIIATHSPFLIDSDKPERVLRFDRREGVTTIHRFLESDSRTRSRMLKDLRRDPKIASALFASGVILVEGDAEEAALPVWLETLAAKEDRTLAGVAFISVHGDGHFRAYADLFDQWGIRWLGVGDGKAKLGLRKLGKKGYAYRSEDFSVMMRRSCPAQLDRALSEVNSDPKDPAVARAVSLSSSPPDELERVWQFVRSLTDP